MFDFVADTYGQDAVGIQNFLEDLRDVHAAYRERRFKQWQTRVGGRKRAGNDNQLRLMGALSAGADNMLNGISV